MKFPVRSVALLLTASLLAGQAAPALAAPEKKKDLRFSMVDELGESKASEYVMRRYPGEPLMPIRIVSGVKSPGVYYLPEGTDMITALTLAGGISPTADADRIHLNKAATQTEKLYSMNDVVGEPKTRNPALAANDIVMIEEAKPVISTNTMLVITAISSLLGIALAAKAINK